MSIQHVPVDDRRLLSRDRLADLANRIQSLVQGGGATEVTVSAWWRGEVRWARNKVSVASDRRDIMVSVKRFMYGAAGVREANQCDDASLKSIVRAAERDALNSKMKRPTPPPWRVPTPELPYPEPPIWSDDTFQVTAEQRGKFARLLSERAADDELLSAGYLEMRASESMHVAFGNAAALAGNPLSGSDDVLEEEGMSSQSLGHAYTRHTQAQCSLTVRDPKRYGSGWAGMSGYDWKVFDSVSLATRALQKCMASLNPVRIEPGRYTVILEPQAVSSLTTILVQSLSRLPAEAGFGPFVLGTDEALGLWKSKLGFHVIDERITLSHDPMDSELGIVPFSGLKPITWIDRGVLKALTYDRRYALQKLNENLGEYSRSGYAMSGGSTTVEEMISTTKRGLLITRFSSVKVLDQKSLLSSGITRDGLWLIENGKITKPAKNMWFTESPLFVLNQVEQLGTPVPVFHPVEDGLFPVRVPPIKSNDFSFSATADAI